MASKPSSLPFPNIKLCSYSFWAVSGECETASEYMYVNCAPACRACEKLTIEGRCPLDPNATDAWGAGDLSRMFEKVTTDAEFQKYEPRILSRPQYAEGESKENVDYQIGPWVVLLENFLTPEECEKLIALGHVEGYERSSDVGELKFDGTYEDDVNEGRTSTNSCKSNVPPRTFVLILSKLNSIDVCAIRVRGCMR